MTMTDPISDLLTRIRNGQQVKKASISCPASKIKLAILKVMKEEGFIRDYSLTEDTKGKIIEISLKLIELSFLEQKTAFMTASFAANFPEKCIKGLDLELQ